VLRTFPELVGRSAQNLVEIGPAVRACKGDIGRSIGSNSHFYIYRREKKRRLFKFLLLFKNPTPPLGVLKIFEKRNSYTPKNTVLKLKVYNLQSTLTMFKVLY